MTARIIPEVGQEHIPGLLVAQQLARKYEDRQLLGFLIEVAKRKDPKAIKLPQLEYLKSFSRHGEYLNIPGPSAGQAFHAACDIETAIQIAGLKVAS